MTIPPFRRAWHVLALTVYVGSLALSMGCQSTTDPRDMDEVEKAKAISSRRKQAEHEFSTFQASDGDDIEALKRYAELHVETTTIAPSSCELCFFNAGLALARVGSYYRAEALLLDRRKQDVSPAEARQLESEIDETIKIMRRHFLESNRYFETYLRQAGGIANPMAYWRLADNYAALEVWQRAIDYLDLFAEVQPLSKEQNDLPAIRSSFMTKLRLQEEKRYEEELKRSGAQKPGLSN